MICRSNILFLTEVLYPAKIICQVERYNKKWARGDTSFLMFKRYPGYAEEKKNITVTHVAS